MKRLCVFCGSSRGTSAAFAGAAQALGETLAARSIELIFGGSHVGLMGVVADAVLAKGGKAVGVLPRFMADKHLAHPRLTELHVVETMHERKQLMAELAEGFIALPGGFGTLEEIFEVITWGQLRLHAHPCGLLNVASFFDPLLEFLRATTASGFVKQKQLEALVVAATPDDLLARFAAFRPLPMDKRVPDQLI